MPRQANLDNPIYEGLTAREMATLRRDYARACSAPSSAITDLVKRNGAAAFAVVWITTYRAHQGKRRRARWPDEPHYETGPEATARKRAARLRTTALPQISEDRGELR